MRSGPRLSVPSSVKSVLADSYDFPKSGNQNADA